MRRLLGHPGTLPYLSHRTGVAQPRRRRPNPRRTNKIQTSLESKKLHHRQGLQKDIVEKKRRLEE
jgi:hypothetical protein